MKLQLDVKHFRERVLQDALTEATAQYWERRARQFEAAAPRRSDFHGHATREELSSAYRRCMATALACRRRAQLLREGAPEDIAPEVLDVLAEVA